MSAVGSMTRLWGCQRQVLSQAQHLKTCQKTLNVRSAVLERTSFLKHK